MSMNEVRRIYQAAEGYAALGLTTEAWDLLDSLPIEAKLGRPAIQLQVNLLVQAEEYRKASFLAETLCRLDPEDTEILVLVAKLRYKGDDLQGAIEWLDQIGPKCVDNAEFHYVRAQCQAQTGDIESAKVTLGMIRQRWPNLCERMVDDPAFDAIFGAG
jgi:thioredoxin-like negative regulator of GroEL